MYIRYFYITNSSLLITVVLSLVMMFAFSSMAMASDVEVQSFNRAPVEQIIDGQLHIDGIPYYSEDEILNNATHEQVLIDAQTNPNSTISTRASGWTLYGTGEYYIGQDWDRCENSSPSTINKKLTTSSYTTYKVTGDVSVEFKSIAKAQIGAEIGGSWGKTTEISYNIPAWWVYELKTACRVFEYKYKMTNLFGTSYAEAHGKGGVVEWLFSNPL